MYNWMHEKLKEDIGIERYNHTIRVVETSKKLALKYKEDVQKTSMAALLHDCGKFSDSRKLLKMIDDFDIILDNVMKNNIQLVHGPLGAEMARRVYGIDDHEILSAIYYHTTGKENMSLLEKIVYISDYIEPGRDFQGVDEVREMAFVDLDKSILWAMDNTIKYVIDRGFLLHLDTVKGRNSLKLQTDME